MGDELKTIKFQLMLSPSEAEAIDEWGFKNRIRTRAEAIRRLCQIGLMTDERVSPLAADVKNHAAAIAAFQTASSQLIEALANGESEPDLRALVRFSAETSGTLTKLAYALRELNGQTHALRENKDFNEVMRDVTENAELFRDVISKLDETVHKLSKSK